MNVCDRVMQIKFKEVTYESEISDACVVLHRNGGD